MAEYPNSNWYAHDLMDFPTDNLGIYYSDESYIASMVHSTASPLEHPYGRREIHTPEPVEAELVALIKIYSIVQSPDHGELYKIDTQHSIMMHKSVFSSYAEFRNTIVYETKAGYLRTQFFRICLCSEIADLIAPTKPSDVAKQLKVRAKRDSGTTTSPPGGDAAAPKWIVTDKDVEEVLQNYLAETKALRYGDPGSARGIEAEPKHGKLELAIVRYTKALASTIAENSLLPGERYYYDIVFKSKRQTAASEDSIAVGMWTRHDPRQDVHPVFKRTPDQVTSFREVTVHDSVTLFPEAAEVFVPNTLSSLTVRDDVLMEFLDFAIAMAECYMQSDANWYAVAFEHPVYGPVLQKIMSDAVESDS